MRTLMVTVGLPFSGKTTWAKSMSWPIVNPDSVRLALHGIRFSDSAEPMVWTMTLYMVKALFLAGHERVILDAENTKKSRRDMWVRPKEWTTQLVLFSANMEVCVGRAKARGDLDICPVIARMFLEWEPLTVEEENTLFLEG